TQSLVRKNQDEFRRIPRPRFPPRHSPTQTYLRRAAAFRCGEDFGGCAVKRALDEVAPDFRAAYERWPHAPNLRQHYDDLVNTYEKEGSSLIELTKSFLETVCWTVINELGATPP